VILVEVRCLSAQQASDLQQQVQQLKQQYEQSTHELQQRISTLEQQLQAQQAGLEHVVEDQSALQQAQEDANQPIQTGATVSSVKLAAEREAAQVLRRESNKIGGRFQRTLPPSRPTTCCEKRT
jgi:DNA repair exonuclease SbcCD ATPase subunit